MKTLGPPTGLNRTRSGTEELTNEPRNARKNEPDRVSADCRLCNMTSVPAGSGEPHHATLRCKSTTLRHFTLGWAPIRPNLRCPDKWFSTRSSAINLIVIELPGRWGAALQPFVSRSVSLNPTGRTTKPDRTDRRDQERPATTSGDQRRPAETSGPKWFP